MSSGAPGDYRSAVIDAFRLALVSVISIGLALFTTGVVSDLLWTAAAVLVVVALRRLWLANRNVG